MNVETVVQQYLDKGILSKKYKDLFLQFYNNYKIAVKKSGSELSCDSFFLTLLEKVKEQLLSPHPFAPYHKQIRSPFDYYHFGLGLLRPLIDFSHSSLHGLARFKEIQEKLDRKENVIFLSNHQIEGDPQVINLLLEKHYPRLVQEMIFVAGARVSSDPLVIPFTLGINLLCVYSKRHIDHPPEQKTEKQLHNQRTMEMMCQLLSEGGHTIWVAPSGGRDRPDLKTGDLHVASFDPSSVEMVYLMSQKASRPTTFYPMALSTYPVMPPPQTVEKDLGEERAVNYSAVHLWIGPAISMEHFPGSEESDKRKKRERRAHFIWSQVKEAYAQFPR